MSGRPACPECGGTIRRTDEVDYEWSEVSEDFSTAVYCETEYWCSDCDEKFHSIEELDHATE